jgi:uncharacterized protein YjbI with pentapeptide repeats
MARVDERVWEPREVLSRYQAGERDFSGLEIESSHETGDLAFRGANLVGADFSRCFIVADFTGAQLGDATFAKANVKTCTFDGADLRNADFSGAAIDAATFSGANLADAIFEGAGAYGYTYVKGERPER